MPNASWLGPLPKWGEQPCARVIPSCKWKVKAFVKARHHYKVQPRFGDFRKWCLWLVATVIHFDQRLYHVILGSWSIECSCRVISVIFKTQCICAAVFQQQSTNCMTLDLGPLQLLTFLLVFSLLIWFIQWIQVLKWMYSSCSVYNKVLRTSSNLQLLFGSICIIPIISPNRGINIH